ncbi:MAG: hypothetical protein AAFQ17_02440, partial [Pseudomonadota bacterium]
MIERDPGLVLMCVPGLSIGHVPKIEDAPERAARPLEAKFPITDSGFIATVATGAPMHRHGIAADAVDDPVLHAARPRCREDFLRTPIWDVLAASGIKTQVLGTTLSLGWPGGTPADVRGSDITVEAVREILGRDVTSANIGGCSAGPA